MENGGEFFLRQLSVGSSPCYYYNSSSTKSSPSKRWGITKKKCRSQMEEEDCENNINGMSVKKRVMVVIDQSTKAKHAMMWALTQIVDRGYILPLLHVVPPLRSQSHVNNKDNEHGPNLANSLGSLCKACKPELV